MTQAINLELLSDGREILIIGEEVLTVNQRKIRLGDKQFTQCGLIEKPIAGFNEDKIKGASIISSMLNTASKSQGTETSVNAFWYDLGGQLSDQVYLKIPMRIGERMRTVLVMLAVDHGDGQRFIRALQDSSMDQDVMRNLLTQVLRVNTDQKINKSQILCTTLALHPESCTRIAAEAVRDNMKPEELYRVEGSQIAFRRIPEKIITEEPNVEKVPQIEFAAQSFVSREADTKPAQEQAIPPEMSAAREAPPQLSQDKVPSREINHDTDPSWSDPTKPTKIGEVPSNIFAALLIPEMITFGRETDYAGNILNPNIPFPNLEGMNQTQKEEAMFQYITQPDVMNYLDWNLYIRSVQSHTDSLNNELNDPKRNNFSFAGNREHHEQLRDTWIFVRDHLDDPRVAWFRIVDQRRQEVEKNIKLNKTEPVIASDHMPISDAEEVKQPQRDDSLQQVRDKKQVPQWILDSLKSIPKDDVLSYFKNLAVKDSNTQGWYGAMQYALNNLDEFPEVKRIISERKK